MTTSTRTTRPAGNLTVRNNGAHQQEEEEEEQRPLKVLLQLFEGLNYVNIGNVVAFLLNVLITYYAGSKDDILWLSNLPTTTRATTNTTTLVTPAPFIFWIWIVVYASQLVFVLAQCLPSYRSLPIIQLGVEFFYMIVCFMHVVWVLLLQRGYMLASWVSMIGVLSILLYTLQSQRGVVAATTSGCSILSGPLYWLWQFPFALHAGWATVVSLVQLNLAVVSHEASTGLQFRVAAMSLIVMFLVGIMSVYKLDNPEFAIASTMMWGMFGIAIQLSAPEEILVFQFNMDILNLVKNATAVLGTFVLAFTCAQALRVMRLRYVLQDGELGRRYYRGNSSDDEQTKQEEEDDEDDDECLYRVQHPRFDLEHGERDDVASIPSKPQLLPKTSTTTTRRQREQKECKYYDDEHNPVVLSKNQDDNGDSSPNSPTTTTRSSSTTIGSTSTIEEEEEVLQNEQDDNNDDNNKKNEDNIGDDDDDAEHLRRLHLEGHMEGLKQVEI